MIAADRTPAIIAALVDNYHDAEDLQAAACLDRAVDLPALAALLPISATDRAIADGLHGLLTDGNDGAEPTDDDRAIACRVAARLAATAANLLAVDPKRNLSDAETLWAMSGKLSGLWEATADAMREEERRRNGPMVNIAETYRLAAEQWKARAEKAESEPCEGCEALQRQYAAASWEATQGAHALAMVSAQVGLTTLPNDPLDAAKAIIDAIRSRDAGETEPDRRCPLQVGDIIDAKDVPPGTLVDRQTPDGPLMTIRLGDRGFHLAPDNETGMATWPWSSYDGNTKVRVLATGLSAATADRVAVMSPEAAREWLAQRVAASRTPWPPGTRVTEGDTVEDATIGTIVSDDGGDRVVVRWDHLPANSPGVRVSRLRKF
jgi:hypothetical protein